MNSKKVAFIICVNNDREFNECLGYLDRLIIPEGYEKDVITITEAPSMAAGYNAGMYSSDAKYKVYIHQDTFIINQKFISDMLKVFEDEEVGLMGVIGTRKMPKDAYAVSAWDTGKIYHNGDLMIWGYQEKNKNYTIVEAVDGVAIATQYDIEFREDLFSDWDFYDISASYEFRRRGYKVVVPKQEECWIYHDDKFSKLEKYDKNRMFFIKEYSKDLALDKVIKVESVEELEKTRFQAREALLDLINAGEIDEVCKVLNAKKNYYIWLKDIWVLATIYQNEKQKTVFDWTGNAEELLYKLEELEWFLKRIEYGVEPEESEYIYYLENYSMQAIVQVCGYYCIRKKQIITKLGYYVQDKTVINYVTNKLSDEKDFLLELQNSKEYKIYNRQYLEPKKIMYVLGEVQDEWDKKINLHSESIVFAMTEGTWIQRIAHCRVCIGVNEGKSMFLQLVLLYLMGCKWNVEKVVYVGKGGYIDNVRRLFVDTDIRQESVESKG